MFPSQTVYCKIEKNDTPSVKRLKKKWNNAKKKADNAGELANATLGEAQLAQKSLELLSKELVIKGVKPFAEKPLEKSKSLDKTFEEGDIYL